MSRELAEDTKATPINVKVNKTVKLENCSEYFVQCVIDCVIPEGGDYVFVPNFDGLSKRGFVAASAVYDGNRIANKIPIRICSLDDSKSMLFKNTRVGYLEKTTIMTNDSVNMIDSDDSRTEQEVIVEILNRHKENLSEQKLSVLKIFLETYSQIFSTSSTDVGLIREGKHEINTQGSKPIHCMPRRVPMHLEDKVEKLIDKLRQTKVIEEANSPWNFPIVVVPKKNGEIRLCVDYRKLNAITARPIFPIPASKELFDSLAGNVIFSSLDLSMGYHQLKMNKNDIEKTAFTTKSGQWQYTKMPFGLCAAPASFQKIMSSILRNFAWKSCIIYLDDILIVGRSFEEHIQNLHDIFKTLLNAGVKLSPKNAFFS